MGLTKLFSLGGVVMWPLLAFSLLATTLIFERLLFWLKIYQHQERLIGQALELYAQKPRAAVELLQQYRQLPLARIFLAGLTLEQSTPEEFRLALESAAQSELPLLKRFNTIFESIIGVAPLLGLLGTILGLIGSFSSLRLGEVAGEEAVGVTSGIGEALVSTAAGLIVAIVTLLFANLFLGLYRRQRAAIQAHSGHLEILYRRYYRRALQRQRSRA
ncbi:MotA/TolQ/ExbB proton channel family protein [Romeria aff. gracilis LEGE 07310]|uniref:MotA/TolQ/ExbB proton channel family protein n=1 Tax=Vasconcelosia minhoensis LEGE 07310 TaxID=915328 RepID=A0A8J7DBM0_9CYAN|nr:MotA/TolQ/ExbB proton channel family protein [Romeria gracilis]MBE9076598.1 MotA/TolQ/ExbB proton channel family protein [Romeria aff. gracilis LEGE 07310]